MTRTKRARKTLAAELRKIAAKPESVNLHKWAALMALGMAKLLERK